MCHSYDVIKPTSKYNINYYRLFVPVSKGAKTVKSTKKTSNSRKMAHGAVVQAGWVRVKA